MFYSWQFYYRVGDFEDIKVNISARRMAEIVETARAKASR